MIMRKMNGTSIETPHPSFHLFSKPYPFPVGSWTGEFPALVKKEKVAGLGIEGRKLIKKSMELIEKMTKILQVTRAKHEDKNREKARELRKEVVYFVEELRSSILKKIPENRRKVFPLSRRKMGPGLYWRINALEAIWLQSIGFSLEEKHKYDSGIQEFLQRF